MGTTRPLNPEEPYYEWDDEGRLRIISECCADEFSATEELVLLRHLAEKHGYTLSQVDDE